MTRFRNFILIWIIHLCCASNIDSWLVDWSLADCMTSLWFTFFTFVIWIEIRPSFILIGFFFLALRIRFRLCYLSYFWIKIFTFRVVHRTEILSSTFNVVFELLSVLFKSDIALCLFFLTPQLLLISNLNFIWNIQSSSAFSLQVCLSDLVQAAAFLDFGEEAVINMFDHFLLFDFLQLLIDFFFQGHAFLLAHLLLNFQHILLGTCLTLLSILFQLFAIGCFNMFHECRTVSNTSSFESIDDRAASFIESVRTANLKHDLLAYLLITVNKDR